MRQTHSKPIRFESATKQAAPCEGCWRRSQCRVECSRFRHYIQTGYQAERGEQYRLIG